MNNYNNYLIFGIIVNISNTLLSINKRILFIVKRLSAHLIIYSTILKINFINQIIVVIAKPFQLNGLTAQKQFIAR